jgi:tellurite resistance protein
MMNAETKRGDRQMEKEPRLKYFPVSIFSIVMGLTGFIIAIQKAETILLYKNSASTYLLYLDALIFVIITLIYVAKIIYYFPDVRDEINNPVRLNFFPTFTISLLLLGIAFIDVNVTLSLYFWIVGVVLHFLATVTILSLWIRQTKFEIQHFNPSWFIPIVGNILVPIVGVKFLPTEVSWFFFSIGIIFWIPMFTIFLYRIIFHHPLSEKLMPTLFILIAPPAIGFLSYVRLNGEIDNFAKILYFFALFLVILLLAQFKIFYKIKFYLSWWAYSFPIASITIATSLMLKETGTYAYRAIFFSLLVPLSILIILLLIKTMGSIIKGDICLKEEK